MGIAIRSYKYVLGAVVFLATSGTGLAQGSNPDVTYQIDTDPLSVVSRAPGLPEGGLFSGFENNENVSLFNGNLVVAHPATPSFPMDGGMSVGLSRTYNSKNVRYDSVLAFCIASPCSANAQEYHGLFHGQSWVGAGWTMHLGRVFRKSYYTEHEYGDDDLLFEDASGTQIQFDPHQPSVEPLIDVNHFPETVCPGGLPSCGWLCCEGNPTGYELELCNEALSGGDCTCTCEDIEYFRVRYSNGTTLKLYNILEEARYEKGFISNADRNGYYTKEIRDTHGNWIEIKYYESENPRFPEAIKEIWVHEVGQDPRMVISTTLWSASDPTDPLDAELSAARAGTLKDLHYIGPGGATVSQRYDYSRGEMVVPPGISYNSGGTRTTVVIPKLATVELPHVDGVSIGVIEYGYDDYESGGLVNRALLSEIRYPHGGVSQYEYDTYIAGSRSAACPTLISIFQNECGTPASQIDTWQDRAERGIVKRTVYPDGLGGPHYTWEWDREFSRESVTEMTHRFILTNPDGTRIQSWFGGDPDGTVPGTTGGSYVPLSPDGREIERATFAGDGVTRLRTVYTDYDGEISHRTGWVHRRHYASVKTRATRTVFNDDTQTAATPSSVCFSPAYVDDGSGERQQTTTFYQRDSNHHWRLTLTEGDYLKAPRIAYTAFDATPDQCLINRHLLDTFDFKSIQEGKKRIDIEYTFDCHGQVAEVRASPEIATLAAPCDAPSGGDWDTWTYCTPSGTETGEVVHDLAYSANGNLFTVDYTGGDTGGNAYGLTYGWQFGQARTAQYDGVTFLSADVDVEAAGLVKASRSPDGVEELYHYDAAGRLEKIAPWGTEFASRVAYPTLSETRLIRSGGAEEIHDSQDDEQMYSSQHYDGLGRVTETRKALPDGGLAKKVVRYDEAGRTIFESVWMPSDAVIDGLTWTNGVDSDNDGTDDYYVTLPADPASGLPRGTVTYYGDPEAANPLVALPDGLGRVRKLVAPDGSETITEYCGPHRQVTVRGIQTSHDDPGTPEIEGREDAVSRYYFDGLERLVIVDTPAGGADAEYRYDLNGELTDVNLIEVVAAANDPFEDWLNGSTALGQVRSFEYDALGRLRSKTDPESGLTAYNAYDVLGNLVEYSDALGSVRGYKFKHTYDSAGRVTKKEKIVSAGELNRLGTRGSFEDLTDWEAGTIDNTHNDLPFSSIAAASSYWTHGNYGSLACINAPPEGGDAFGLYLGYGCKYNFVGTTPHARRTLVAGVERDDVLTFAFWRHVRENAVADRDVFTVYIVAASEQNNTANRRVAFRYGDNQASMLRWRQAPTMRVADLYSDWQEGETRDLYVYIEFDKGDVGGTGLGIGVFVDDMFLGRRGSETLAEYEYDFNACSGSPAPGGEACVSGSEPTNYSEGKLVRTKSYHDDQLLAESVNVFKGLNGRLSGVSQTVDWTGFEQPDSWTTTRSYNSHGLMEVRVGPYISGAELPRGYVQRYRRNELHAIQSDAEEWPKQFLAATEYDHAGGVCRLEFGNGTVQTTTPDVMFRPRSIVVTGPDLHAGTGTVDLWNSGQYTYDGAGNITAIEGQTFLYDLHGRLTSADVRGQAQGMTDIQTVDYAYDPYGNMTNRTWFADNSALAAPTGFDLAHQHTGNRIQLSPSPPPGEPAFEYDHNGNMTRIANMGVHSHAAAMWDLQNRMMAFYRQAPEDGGSATEHYLYDLNGYRVVQYSEIGDGKPRISLRDQGGELLSRYVIDPEVQVPRLARDFVRGHGRILVERENVPAPPTLQSHATFVDHGGRFGFEVVDGVAGDVYTVDIRTDSGYAKQLPGIALDAGHSFWVDASELVANETNFVRVALEEEAERVFSSPVTLVRDSTVTSSSENQVNRFSVSRVGNDVTLRWTLHTANGKNTNLYFDRADGGGKELLNPSELHSSIREYVVSDQALATQCANVEVVQVENGNDTLPTPFLPLPSIGGIQDLGLNQPECVDEPPPQLPTYVIVDTYHHRDHLGSLRISSDSAGGILGGHDYFPFGTEITPLGQGAVQDSPMRYTGHERDTETQIDYMLARFYSSGTARFLGVDPGPAKPGDPRSWNRFAYSLQSPLVYVDPDGELPYSVLKRDYPDVASRIAREEPMVTAALRKATGNESFEPKFFSDRHYEYRVVDNDLVPAGARGAVPFVARTGGVPWVGLKRNMGQRTGVVESDGGISGGVLRGVMFLAAFSKTAPGMAMYDEGVRSLLENKSTLALSDDDLKILQTRLTNIAEHIISEEARAAIKEKINELFRAELTPESQQERP